MGEGGNPVWGIHLVSGRKRRRWAGTGREEKIERQRWGKKRTKGASWFLAFILGASRIMNPFLRKMNGQL